MSFFADRETVIIGFAVGVVSICLGVAILFTHDTRIDQYYAYALAAAGIVFVFVSALVRSTPRVAGLLRWLLAAYVVFLLLVLLLKDLVERAYP